MTNFIPIFPLNIVVFPGEKLNLHIFEPRYKQLIRECFDLKKVFGIPAIVDNEIMELGTTVEILSIEKEYDTGEMDIKTEAQQVFRILEHVKTLPDKLYSGAIVTYPDNVREGIASKMKKVLQEVHQFHQLLQVEKDYKKKEEEMTCYDVGHHVGLSTKQEYELLTLLREDQRQEYLQRHLKQSIPMLTELKNLKERIQLNGHFRKLSTEGF
ncbi:MAG: LON peptidase substrate-binding domain-containing protein [Chitinophagaceae bacterium]|nr:LON peptidase substrate-binding domain-containing protein [Chitinophagaceae bacterium]